MRGAIYRDNAAVPDCGTPGGEPLVAQGRCDAVTDLAELFPTQVLLTLLPVATVGTASPKM